MDKNTVFWPGNWKKRPSKRYSSFTAWPLYLKIYTKVPLNSQKTWPEWIFEFFIFALFIAQKPTKMAILLFLEFWCAINSKKSKNSKMRSGQVFLQPWEVPLCKFSSKMVKEWQRSRNFKVIFFKILVKTLYFCPFFEKNDLRIATPPSFSDHFTRQFAKRYFSSLPKTCLERIFELLLFLLFIARQIPKIAKMAIFACFCAINSAKMKNSKIRSCQVFWTIERYLCANFQVKWSSGEWGVAF